MTAIACTKTKMVSDRKVVIDGDIYILVTKIEKMKNGDIVGTAGNFEDGKAFIEWYQRKNRDVTGKPQVEDDFEALVLTKEGEILWYNYSFSHVLIEDEFFAIGCGAKPVIALMKVGKEPKEAIEIVSTFDNAVSSATDTLER